MTPIEFYKIFSDIEVFEGGNPFSEFEKSNRTKYKVRLLVEQIIHSNSPQALKIFLEELEEIRLADYWDKEFEGKFTPP